LKLLVPSEAKGQHAYHGRFTAQPQSLTTALDDGNSSVGDFNEEDGDFGGDHGVDEGGAGGSGAAAEGSSAISGASMLTEMPRTGAEGSEDDGQLPSGGPSGVEGQDDNRHSTPPLPSSSVTSKRPFSAMDGDSAILPPSS
jgi:hypothetical protein